MFGNKYVVESFAKNTFVHIFLMVVAVSCLFPLFWMVESKSTVLIFAAVMIAMNFGHGMMFGPESAYFPNCSAPASATAALPSASRFRRRSAAASRRSLPPRWPDISVAPGACRS